MIISVNPKPSLTDFKELMRKTDIALNSDAAMRPDYYATRSGNPLEDDVLTVLQESAKETPFANTIEKISGQKFPDIIAAKYYGVEVKSTKDDHWTSTGSSILESTRVPGIERIYMTFGKLGGEKVMFISRPYEECLYGIAVTHMPRYLIDMTLEPGETIFDKMQIPYDELRKMDNPIAPVAKYYKSQLRPGERLWRTGDSTDETVSATIRLWKNLSSDEKKNCIAFGCANFPEIFAGDYDNYALWLTSKGVVDPHIRDQFSAGGQEEMRLSSGEIKKFPGVYRRIKDNKDRFITFVRISESAIYNDIGNQSENDIKERLLKWATVTAKKSNVDDNVAFDALKTLLKL